MVGGKLESVTQTHTGNLGKIKGALKRYLTTSLDIVSVLMEENGWPKDARKVNTEPAPKLAQKVHALFVE